MSGTIGRTVVALTGASFLCAGLSFSYLDRRYGKFPVEGIFWVVWTLLGFGVAWLRGDRNPAGARRHWKWQGIVGATLAIFPGFLMFGPTRWVALSLMLVIGARAAIMHTRRDFHFTLTTIFVVSFLAASHALADWTLWVYLGPCWLLAGLALTWDHAAEARISPWTKVLLNGGFMALCLVVALLIHAAVPQPNLKGFGFLPPGTDHPGLLDTPTAEQPGIGRLPGGGGAGEAAAQAGGGQVGAWAQELKAMRRALGDKSMPGWQRDLLGQVLSSMEGMAQALDRLGQKGGSLLSDLDWRDLLAWLFAVLLLSLAWRWRYRIGMRLAMSLAWLLSRHRPMASMRVSAASLGWVLHVHGHPRGPGQSVREHWSSLPRAPEAVRAWVRKATNLYGASRFGGQRPTPASADQLRQLVTVTADALLRR